MLNPHFRFRVNVTVSFTLHPTYSISLFILFFSFASSPSSSQHNVVFPPPYLKHPSNFFVWAYSALTHRQSFSLFPSFMSTRYLVWKEDEQILLFFSALKKKKENILIICLISAQIQYSIRGKNGLELFSFSLRHKKKSLYFFFFLKTWPVILYNLNTKENTLFITQTFPRACKTGHEGKIYWHTRRHLRLIKCFVIEYKT